MKRKISGQAMIEYILLVCVLAISVFSVIKLFSKWMELTFQEHVRLLGYEVPQEKEIALFKKQVMKSKMDAIVLQNQIGSYYGKR